MTTATTSAFSRSWMRMSSIILSVVQTETRLANTTADWEIAKNELKERIKSDDAAQKEAAEQYPEHAPDDVWQNLQKLHRDRVKALEIFDLKDREKRRDERFIKDQKEAHWKLSCDVYGADDKLQFTTGDKDDGSPTWHSVLVEDVLGAMFAPHFTKLGIVTMKDAKAALDSSKIKEAIASEQLSDEDAKYFRQQVILFLNAKGVAHELGKPPTKVHVPEPVKKGGDGAGVPGEYPDGGEISAQEYEALTIYRADVGIAKENKVERFASVGPNRVAAVGSDDRFIYAVEAFTRDAFEKDHGKENIRHEADEAPGSRKYWGVLIAGPGGEYVLGVTLRFPRPAAANPIAEAGAKSKKSAAKDVPQITHSAPVEPARRGKKQTAAKVKKQGKGAGKKPAARHGGKSRKASARR